MTSDYQDYLWAERHAALYRSQLSSIYHRKRERFFEFMDRGAKAIAIIGGASSIGTLLSPDWKTYLAGAIAITSTLSLLFAFSDKSKRHAEIARDFKLVESEIVAKGVASFAENDNDVAAWQAKLLEIESKELPTLGALVILCQNEMAIAENQPQNVKKIPTYQRLLANFINFHTA